MRLTAELIQNSLSYLNPLNDRELDLRGHKIPAIENLGVAKDQSDAIDFTDNDITTLANFPLSPRLRVLLLAHNRIHTIQSTLASSLPNLETLVLTDNKLAELSDLDALQHFPRLTHLTLLRNPVAKKENYRLWVIHRSSPSLRFLDYQKVRAAERSNAEELFGTVEEPSALAAEIMGVKSRTFDPGTSITNGTRSGASAGEGKRVKLNAKERKRVELMIKNAKSLAEMTRLEKELAEGRVPGGILEDGDDDGDEEMG